MPIALFNLTYNLLSVCVGESLGRNPIRKVLVIFDRGVPGIPDPKPLKSNTLSVALRCNWSKSNESEHLLLLLKWDQPIFPARGAARRSVVNKLDSSLKMASFSANCSWKSAIFSRKTERIFIIQMAKRIYRL